MSPSWLGVYSLVSIHIFCLRRINLPILFQIDPLSLIASNVYTEIEPDKENVLESMTSFTECKI